MADAVKVSGTISHLSETQQITEKMAKRLVVLTTGGQYPEQIATEFINDKIDLTHDLAEGQNVTISVNIRGREWNGEYFVSLAGWKVEPEGAAPAQQPAAQSANRNPALRATAAPVDDSDSSDLPF